MTELKPCPFCGDEPTLRKSQAPFRAEYMVICVRGCGACNGWKDTVDEAIAAWNTRNESDELPEWVKNAIENEGGQNLNKRSQLFYCGFVQALNWALTLRKPEEK